MTQEMQYYRVRFSNQVEKVLNILSAGKGGEEYLESFSHNIELISANPFIGSKPFSFEQEGMLIYLCDISVRGMRLGMLYKTIHEKTLIEVLKISKIPML